MSDINKFKEELKDSIMNIFKNPLMGTILQAWGVQDSNQLNGLLRQLLGSVELVRERSENESEEVS